MTMHAVSAVSGELHDTEVPAPEPQAHDLLVRVEAVSVNPVDVKTLRAAHPDPRILGFDAAGTVVAVGPEVSRFTVGDAVYYCGDYTRPGANADLHAVDERLVGHKPASLSFAEAAAMPLTTLTAAEALFDHLGAGPSTTGTLLVVGASGGVGSILVQLARRLTGLRVIGTASRPESREWVAGLGAHEVVDHRDLGATVRAVAPDGVDAIISAYTDVPVLADLLRPWGHLVAIDGSHHDVGPLKPGSQTFHWEYVFARPAHRMPDMARQGDLLEQVSGELDAGRLRGTATRFIPGLTASGLREAYEAVGSGRMLGKLVVHR
ncbi:zinc-binding alcohol dehydrogenase family protein [Isoptericola sp. b441]|uniref:Zinc-type alcohol dehydrogenase-like protein n=1 Tax=Actinotalea lenta TaxID=3064654 RepID=A0ABT9DF34_9CELL|nr:MULTISPECIES: zinc-binding alcohol dehydrogenase family protein [unclassified Isoptericola]MDO8108358.1 zinc-binding alcohol dehydrogenase family protein [Isoptericola sp. b441]MDO8119776.1 zinc-binding alcohol dehydrogenase family protein [Isoptericola sp. b490]